MGLNWITVTGLRAHGPPCRYVVTKISVWSLFTLCIPNHALNVFGRGDFVWEPLLAGCKLGP